MGQVYRAKLVRNTSGYPESKYPIGTELEVEEAIGKRIGKTIYRFTPNQGISSYAYREDIEILGEVSSSSEFNFAQVAMSK